MTLSWYFEDEGSVGSEAVLDKVTKAGAHVPSLCKLEVANGLRSAMRRKKIDQVYRDVTLRRLAMLGIKIDADTGANAWTSTLHLADRFDLTIYDAIYLELAQRLMVPLASLDKALLRAGDGLGLTTLGS